MSDLASLEVPQEISPLGKCIGSMSSKIVRSARVTKRTILKAPSAAPPLKISPWDTHHLAMAWGYVEATWFYEEELDAEALKVSLLGLLELYPALSGRPKRQKGGEHVLLDYCIVTTGQEGVPFIELEVEGSARAAMERHNGQGAGRGFANVPRAYQSFRRGDQALMTVTLTRFGKGGSALGVAVSHAMVDGTGFYRLVHTWAHAHRQGWSDPSTPQLLMARPDASLWDGVTSKLQHDEKSMYDVVSWVGRLKFWVAANVFEFWQGKSRARVFFSHDELRAIKEATPCARGITPTTNEALCARLSLVLAADILHFKANTKTSLALFASFRAPRISEIAPEYLGNAYTILVNAYEGGWEDGDLEAICTVYHSIGELLRSEREEGQSRYAHEQSLLEAGTVKLPFDPLAQSLVANIQGKFPILDISFGSGDCIGFIPQNLGEAMLLVPAPGGMHVYFQLQLSKGRPKNWIERVEDDAFKERVLSL